MLVCTSTQSAHKSVLIIYVDPIPTNLIDLPLCGVQRLELCVLPDVSLSLVRMQEQAVPWAAPVEVGLGGVNVVAHNQEQDLLLGKF